LRTEDLVLALGFGVLALLVAIALIPSFSPAPSYVPFEASPQQSVTIISNTSVTLVAILILLPLGYYLFQRYRSRPFSQGGARPERFCVQCGRSLSAFPEMIRLCPYCGKELEVKT